MHQHAPACTIMHQRDLFRRFVSSRCLFLSCSCRGSGWPRTTSVGLVCRHMFSSLPHGAADVRRRRKTALERRQQKLRSEARCIQKVSEMLLQAVRCHRGGALTAIGSKLLEAVQVQTFTAAVQLSTHAKQGTLGSTVGGESSSTTHSLMEVRRLASPQRR